MYAKIFTQIYDSSIVENPETRFTFMDMLVLSDANGVVDMTHEAIARRTNRPLDLIRKTIAELESPDDRSRTPDADGRRLKRLDEHRDWGWMIVNYDTFRKIASEEQRREKTAARVAKYRSKVRGVTPCNADVTQGNGALRMKRHAEGEGNGEAINHKASGKCFTRAMTELTSRFDKALGDEWENDRQKWMGRIKNSTAKAERVSGEVEGADREGRMKKGPAQYAEHIWKEFK